MKRIAALCLLSLPLFAEFEEYQPDFVEEVVMVEEIITESFGYETMIENKNDLEAFLSFLEKEPMPQVFDPIASEIQELLEVYVEEGSSAVDIGAELGAYTTELSQLVGARGSVYSFENEQFNDLALNAVDGQLNNVKLFKEEMELDAFGLENVSLMHISAHGKELDILKGAKATIEKNKPVILIRLTGGIPNYKIDKYLRPELNKRIAFLERLGYQVTCLNQVDWIAIPKEVMDN